MRQEVLEPYAAGDPLVPLLLTLSKTRTAEQRARPGGDASFLHPGSGRIHAGFRQLGTEVGRLSCAEPNVQGLPPQLKRVVKPPTGRRLLEIDLSQVQLRIVAVMAPDEGMLALYRSDLKADLHAKTAADVLGADPQTVSGEEWKRLRQAAKPLNFGLLYGMQPAKLRSSAAADYGIDWTLAEAAAYRQAWFAAYPGVAAWHERTPEYATCDTRTRLGRRRLQVRARTERLATPIQGIEADLLKTILGRLWLDRGQAGSAKLMNTVHDSLIYEVNAGDEERVARWVFGHIAAAGREVLPEVPVLADAKVMDDWGEQRPQEIKMAELMTNAVAAGDEAGS
jgi:DNA polymerase-1